MAIPGDIIAIPKLKETETGDTLCQENDPIIFKPVEPLQHRWIQDNRHGESPEYFGLSVDVTRKAD